MKIKNIKYKTFAALTASVIIIASCTPTTHVRGNIIEDFQLSEVVPGYDSRTDVLKKMGSPTTKATFDDNVWYYIGQETEKRGILDPEVVKERIIVVTFNDEGLVETIQDLDNNRVELPIAREKTPTSGNEITVMQQFLGNIGRFNPPQAK
jgi:outer membrane protein assembly factor BamE (lipoprotein component of BamABCDE complex)